MKKLDGAGTARMATLSEAVGELQHIHSLVERLAIEIRGNRNTSPLRQQISRAATTLGGRLKAQFGMISDQVAGLVLVLTRGGGEANRLRALREFVAQIRTALEIAIVRTEDAHAVDDGPRPGRPGDSRAP